MDTLDRVALAAFLRARRAALQPEDVGLRILRIADPRGTHVTGQVLTVDGGLELI
ncbi:hypothetical protein ACH4LT_33360 [Streptomyces clavifer]|uniref:hypothetical protein n=1 Tax=Streptomyces clavifer TaxID=68188 RepID=UPI0037B593C7